MGSTSKRIYLQEDIQLLLYKILDGEREDSVIYIEPLLRYGNSGANLFLIYFSKISGGSLPFLLKTFRKPEKFNNEIKGMKSFERKYDFISYDDYPDDNGKLSGILLKNHYRTKEANNPKTLADMLYKENAVFICDIINNAFTDLEHIYETNREEECDIKESYAWYLKEREYKTTNIIEALSSNSIEDDKIFFYGQEITNPVYILNNLIKKTKIRKSLIHGDFHPNNIVVNENNAPRIIDFEWSCENDIYIDFSLLEISVRYWKSPFINCKIRTTLEDAFLDENIQDCNEDKNAQEMITIVREIRKWCRRYTTEEKYDFGHHLLSQFLVLYGLQSFTDTYNPFIVIPFLAKLGDKLKELEYVK